MHKIFCAMIGHREPSDAPDLIPGERLVFTCSNCGTRGCKRRVPSALPSAEDMRRAF